MRILGFLRLCTARRAFGLRNCSTKNPTKANVSIGVGHGYLNVIPESCGAEAKAALKTKQCVYAGFDPTADSLHIGHLMVLVNLLQWQRAGHQVIIVLGGATGTIGDPSEGTRSRPQLSDTILKNNLDGIRRNIQTVFSNSAKFYNESNKKLLPPIVVNNMDWHKDIDIMSFSKNISQHCSMQDMLSRRSVEAKLSSEDGMSFAEFMYQTFQAYDWLHLFRRYNCRFQVGGEDQLDNLLAGRDLIDRIDQKKVYGLTLPVLTTRGDRKIGKTSEKTVWLSPLRSSSFELFQFFVRSSDSDAVNYLRYFTLLTKQEISLIAHEHRNYPEKRTTQRLLARYVTRLCHGDEGLAEAKRTTDLLYNMSIDNLSQFTAEEIARSLTQSKMVDVDMSLNMRIVDLAMKAGCFKTENDAFRIINAGGFYLNNTKACNPQEAIVPDVHILPNRVTVLRVGKKTYHIVRWL